MTNAEINASLRIAIAELSKVSNATGRNVSIKTYLPNENIDHEFSVVEMAGKDHTLFDSVHPKPDTANIGYEMKDYEKYSTFDFFTFADEERASYERLKKEARDAS